MKRIIILVLVVLLALSVGFASTGSGKVVAHEVDVNGFDKIEARDGFTVNISQGDTFSVVVHIDDNLVEHLQVVKKGDTLVVDMSSFSSHKDVTAMRAEVTMPELTSLILKNGAHATASGSGEELYVEVSDGSGADISAFLVENAIVKAYDGSRVTVNVSDSLTAGAYNGSQVYYLGNPTDLTTDAANGGKVIQMDEKNG